MYVYLFRDVIKAMLDWERGFAGLGAQPKTINDNSKIIINYLSNSIKMLICYIYVCIYIYTTNIVHFMFPKHQNVF